MDFQIACCYWFLSRGYGRCLQWSESICFADAEEAEEVPADAKCKTRNCSNRCDPLCAMKMCSQCCHRLQRKTREFNHKNPSNPRVGRQRWVRRREKWVVLAIVTRKWKRGGSPALIVSSATTIWSRGWCSPALVPMNCAGDTRDTMPLILMGGKRRAGKKWRTTGIVCGLEILYV